MTKKQLSEYARYVNSHRKTFGGGRPVVLRACPKCGIQLGAREMQKHQCLRDRPK
jgi:hypothetical protein